eukprot:gene762-biopygen43
MLLSRHKESEAFTDAALKQSLLKEANVLLNLHCHGGIPKLLGVVMEIKPYCLVTSFHGLNRESSTVNAILMTGVSCLIPGMPKGKEDWLKVLCSLGDALLHIHTTGYVHGDIKTDNVLVEEGLIAVITDFGKSVLATRSKINSIPLSERDEYCKKYPWVAPEVIHDMALRFVLTAGCDKLPDVACLVRMLCTDATGVKSSERAVLDFF